MKIFMWILLVFDAVTKKALNGRERRGYDGKREYNGKTL